MPSASSSSGSGSRKSGSLSSLEKKVYHSVLSAPNNTLTQDEVLDRLSDIDTSQLLGCLNSLLRKSLFVVQHGEMGLQYVASSKSEASMIGSMDTEEALVFRHIRDSNTEGIWTKMLKNRTGLHQTLMLKALKSLEGKGQIKSVKSVKNPTRKIYMLAHLTPSVELSGGPWYTDNELDTAFIMGLSNVCLQFIQDATWPSGHREGNRRLYPSSYTKYLPTATQILDHLQKKAVTSVKLDVGDIQDLLETMVYEEKIEKVPILGGAALDGGAARADEEAWATSGTRKRSKSNGGRSKSSRSKSSRMESKKKHRKNRSKGRLTDSETGSETPSDISNSESESDSGSDDEGEDEAGPTCKRGGKRKRSSRSRSKGCPSSSKGSRGSKSRKSSRKASKQRSNSRTRKSRLSSHSRWSQSVESGSSNNDESSNDSDLGSEEEEGEERRVRSIKSRVLVPEPEEDEDEEEDEEDLGGHDLRMDASLYVYRALAPAWLQQGFTETPCARCPVFDFCRPGGPVNASCVYYEDWIEGGLAEDEDDEDDESSSGREDGDGVKGVCGVG